MKMRNYKYMSNHASARTDYAIKMLDLEAFCREHDIHTTFTKDSFYFSVNGKKYRVSNHSMEDSFQKSGGKYHRVIDPERINIKASKLKLKEIYRNLCDGYELDEYGDVINYNR